MDIKEGYWINDNDEWYIIARLFNNTCRAVKVEIKKDGSYKVLKCFKCFTIHELQKCRICEY